MILENCTVAECDQCHAIGYHDDVRGKAIKYFAEDGWRRDRDDRDLCYNCAAVALGEIVLSRLLA